MQGSPEVIDRLLVVLQVAVPEPAVGVHHHLLRLILSLLGFFQHGSLHNNVNNNYLLASGSLSILLCGTLFLYIFIIFFFFTAYDFQFRRTGGARNVPNKWGGGGGGLGIRIYLLFTIY